MQPRILNRFLLCIEDGNIEAVKLGLLEKLRRHFCLFVVARDNDSYIGVGRGTRQIAVAGETQDAGKAASGLALVKANVGGIDFDKRVPEWTKYYALLDNAPGLGNDDFAKLAQAEIGTETGRSFNETPIAYKTKLIGGKTELRGEIKKHFKPLNKALFRGKSVPLGVMWAGGGGHFMVFTDIKTKTEGGKSVKYYLVSDPWEGHSGWMSGQELIDGKFQKIGASQGAIDSIYL